MLEVLYFRIYCKSSICGNCKCFNIYVKYIKHGVDCNGLKKKKESLDTQLYLIVLSMISRASLVFTNWLYSFQDTFTSYITGVIDKKYVFVVMTLLEISFLRIVTTRDFVHLVYHSHFCHVLLMAVTNTSLSLLLLGFHQLYGA